MTIWCQLGKKPLNMKKSLTYMMRKRPVSQADRAPPNAGSATPKQLVLVRTTLKPGLPDSLFPVASHPDTSGCLPSPCDWPTLWASRISPLMIPQTGPFTLVPALCTLSHFRRHLCFSSQRVLGLIFQILSRMSLFHLERPLFHSL